MPDIEIIYIAIKYGFVVVLVIGGIAVLAGVGRDQHEALDDMHHVDDDE